MNKVIIIDVGTMLEIEEDYESYFKRAKEIIDEYREEEMNIEETNEQFWFFQHCLLLDYDNDEIDEDEIKKKFKKANIKVKIISKNEYEKIYMQGYLVFCNNKNDEDTLYSLSKILSNFNKKEYEKSIQNNEYYIHKELYKYDTQHFEEVIECLDILEVFYYPISKYFHDNFNNESIRDFLNEVILQNQTYNKGLNDNNTSLPQPIQNAQPLDLSMPKIKTFDSFFANKIVGQDKPIELVKQLLISLLYDLDENRKRPAGVFFFTGPTGVGKTELAKALNEFLYNNQNLNRLDMSEYKSEMAIQKLIGAPHGLVGYEEGGVLINLMKKNPNSIILFDEIEKADKTVFDIFLQILDEGFVTSNKGEKVFFNNNIIIFTSNIGANYITNKMSNNKIEQIIKQAINEFFNYELNRPEILGRIGMENIVCFNMINKKEDLFKILDIHFNKFIESLNSKKIKLNFNREQVYNSILLDVDPIKGARDIRNEFEVFKKHFNKALFENELDLDALKNKTINFTYDNVKVKITKLTNNK